MYKLTVELKDNQELMDFVIKLGGLPSSAKVVETPVIVPEVVEEKPKKAAKEPKAVKAVQETVAAAQVQEELPPVIPSLPAFDRDGAIAKATETIKTLNQSMSGPEIAKILADVYVKAECPAGTKISLLSDEQLQRFMPQFLSRVAAGNKSPESSFI